jgi:uncharacterized membrane protein YeaQ/YmgE (transglycosylase-associated protein family)
MAEKRRRVTPSVWPELRASTADLHINHAPTAIVWPCGHVAAVLARSVKMGAQGLIVMLVIGAIAGWLAGQIVKGYGFGLIGNIVVGIVGAFVAGFLLPAVGISIGSGLVGAIIHSTIGAVILLFLLRLVKRA